MSRAAKFSDILDLVDHMPLEDKEAMIDVLKRRTADQRRAQIAREAVSSDKEYRKGKAKTGTADQIMREIVG